MKQLNILFVFVTYFYINYGFQNLYELKQERCDISNIDHSLVDLTYKCYKLSRNELYLNISVIPKVPINTDQDAQILITGYQFRSNEYRKGPIEFMLGACAALKRKDFDIPNMIADSNLKCPFQVNHTYYVHKLAPNASNLPPLIPEGRWKFELKFLYKNEHTVFIVNWYEAVEYPVRRFTEFCC